MTALAYLVTTRRDIGPIFPYLFDLRPDGLYRARTITPPGQTRHLPDPPELGGTPALLTAMDGSVTTVSVLRGLAGWAIDNVANQTLTLTAAQALAFEQGVLGLVDSVSAITATAVDAVLNAVPGVTGSSAFPGPKSTSTGSVTDVLRILADYSYQVPAGVTVAGPGGVFPLAVGAHAPQGGFYRAPKKAPSRDGLPPNPSRPPLTVTQPPPEQVPLIDCAELRQSIRKGWLSHLVDPGFRWHRGNFTYGPNGTARTTGGKPIPGLEAGPAGAYRARGAIVYDAQGSVIA